MSFPRYKKYKPSGVEWLGDVPEHWEVFSLKRDLDFLTSGSRGWAENYADEGELFIRIANLTRKTIALDLSDIQRVAVPDGAEGSRTKVQSGDVLFSITAYLGSVAVIPDDLETAYVSQHVALARLRQIRLIPRWVGYVALSFIGQTWFETQSYGGTKIQLSLDDVRNLPVTVPPTSEQQKIVAFLDRETARIDELVAEQRRLMELLKEKRQAVISHAVTQGLNPKARMKPSGIEWLGDVPEHWSVVPVVYRYDVQLGKMLDSTKITGEHLRPYLRVFDVQWGEINTEELPQMDFDESARTKFRLIPGDLLVNEGGSYPGRSAIWTGGIDECYYQKALHRLRPHRPDNDSTRFIYFVMFWAANQGVFVAGGNETTIEHLPAEKLRRYRFAFPPIKEQLQIATFLDIELAKFDTLTVEAQRAIDLLQERRTAMISAAVTGQIDVRKF
jgi:type I restriction enzyme S subunit